MLKQAARITVGTIVVLAALGVLVLVWWLAFRLHPPTSWNLSAVISAGLIVATSIVVALSLTFGLTEGTKPRIKAKGVGWGLLFFIIFFLVTLLFVSVIWPWANT